ncbi:hypothetical protein [Sorangium sp. So ce315]|uniref:hypothetical protein n=1 Tax=Sorangium sp. So ce315 TaxID=3133299 RepID=UPI003F61B8A3
MGTAEVFDPAAGTWTAVASMPSVRSGDAPPFLPDGSVLVAGGHALGRRNAAARAGASAAAPAAAPAGREVRIA